MLNSCGSIHVSTLRLSTPMGMSPFSTTCQAPKGRVWSKEFYYHVSTLYPSLGTLASRHLLGNRMLRSLQQVQAQVALQPSPLPTSAHSCLLFNQSPLAPPPRTFLAIACCAALSNCRCRWYCSQYANWMPRCCSPEGSVRRARSVGLGVDMRPQRQCSAVPNRSRSKQKAAYGCMKRGKRREGVKECTLSGEHACCGQGCVMAKGVCSSPPLSYRGRVCS